jgi:transposase
MEVLYPRCYGLDIHKKEATACAIILRKRETGGFSTVTNDLLRFKASLRQPEVTHVAMESTGVFWKPIYSLLEDDFTLLLANPQRIKALPGRKTATSEYQRTGLLSVKEAKSMLNQQTVSMLHSLKLFGIARSLEERLADPKQAALHNSSLYVIILKE